MVLFLGRLEQDRVILQQSERIHAEVGDAGAQIGRLHVCLSHLVKLGIPNAFDGVLH